MVCLACKRQPASLPCCYYHRPVLALLHRGKWDVLFSRKSWLKAKGQTSCTWQLPSHLPLATLPLCRHKLLIVRIPQQRETKSAFASKKTGQGQPPATPDSNPASSGNRKHFLGKSRYSRACLNHPSTTRRLGKELSAGAVHQPAAWCELAPAVRIFQEPLTGLECSHCRWLTS